MFDVRICPDSIDPPELQRSMAADPSVTGAVVSFTGYVRGEGIAAMHLEHYPGMTEASIRATVASARRRWPLQDVQVVHRVGELFPGDPIVWVGVAARHRAAAFTGCEFVMDYLKVAAPLWKREQDLEGEWNWVEARASDVQRAGRWGGAS